MKSALNIFLMILLGLSVSFCSMFSKDTEEKEEETQQYDQYSSSGVYNDIEGESRDVSSDSDDDYSDDAYGSTDEEGDDDEGDDDEGEGDDEALLAGGETNEPAYTPPADEPEEPAYTASAAPGNEPLPVMDEPKPVKKKKKKKWKKPRRAKASVAKSNFKNGMYRMGRRCNMRKGPSTKARKMGKVQKGKKLWVEAHNKKWVKVYKKSGAVYLHKSCL